MTYFGKWESGEPGSPGAAYSKRRRNRNARHKAKELTKQLRSEEINERQHKQSWYEYD